MNKVLLAITAALALAIAVVVVFWQRSQSQLAASQAALSKQAVEKARPDAEQSNTTTQSPPATTAPSSDTEVLRLRGEVGKLKRETAELAASKTNGPSALSGLTSDPEMAKVIRNQQKAGMSMIYRGLTNRVSLSADQVGKLNEMLADGIMENIDRITEVLRDGKSAEQMDAVFTAQEAALREKVRQLLGDDALTQYDDYTRNLASSITSEQFKSKLSGDSEAKDQKTRQFYELLQAETQRLLAENGLSPDYQLVPTLNFRNFASDAIADRNLKLLDEVYARAAAKAGAFLSEQELASFTEFRTTAINLNRMALKANRQLMMPGPR